ncbi:hypothetical protein A1O3_06867 [Capronia epimyces CBS 606.96]|uniref:Major facilitator superfamily (MFS) profile domain-containing protein n=1 Tax=Capronia epimyces CBS 606.96 TaxID=1182542 RepID=W9Y089_9EURO|nr:uncharacterized protein A1O3_06867 [Capronia epimyces CBS 606.96]EXJ83050.1 hypothetical protein A1O3_06867 [Capronia epimyces CBS 606.96]
MPTDSLSAAVVVSSGKDEITEKTTGAVSPATEVKSLDSRNLTIVPRGDAGSVPDLDLGQVTGVDDDAVLDARRAFTAEEEKRLIRRIDWRLLPLLSILYMVKTIDAANVSNARIMGRGTPYNIMTELGISSNQYNFVTTAYYVS